MLRKVLPVGLPLPDEVWQSRHRFIMALLAAHVPVIAAFALWQRLPLWHVALEAGLPLALLLAARWASPRRTAAATLSSLGLLTCSAVLVHLSGGYIEMHFHFFVMMPIISLYHDWTPFLTAIGYVALHHGVMGSLDPASVYNHPDAIANPWKWALIHAAFILGICAASVYNWRLNERAMARQVASERASARFSADLLRMASHELNTPLTPLSLQLLMLSSGELGPLTERQRRAVAVLERNMDRLSRLIRDVLEASRLREGRLALAREPVDLRAVLEESSAVYRDLAAKRGIAFQVEATTGLTLEGDPFRLQQVFANLLSNAFKFTADGGRIALRAAPRGDEVWIQVEDSGRGLDPEGMHRLFQPFSQLDRRDGSRGMGLGLYISRGIVEQHRGRLWAESPGRGQGASFWVALPLVVAPTPPARLGRLEPGHTIAAAAATVPADH